MSTQSTVLKLEAYLQEETSIQGRLLSLLTAQEKAVIAGDGAALEITGADLERELSSEPRRERRRRELLSDLARSFGVPARILTIGSVVERLGEQGDRLARLREDLREALVLVRKKATKVAIVARGQQEVMNDVMRLVFGGGDELGGGMIVNAEA